MKTTVQVINDILNREGSTYTNRANDRGGPTKYGITLATLQAYRNKPTTMFDVKALTEAEAREIYMHNYVIGPGYNKISPTGELLEHLIDAGVQHSVHKAVQLLQRACGMHDDGAIGAATVTACKIMNSELLLKHFISERLKYYGDILQHDPRQLENAAGWFHRMASVVRDCATN